MASVTDMIQPYLTWEVIIALGAIIVTLVLAVAMNSKDKLRPQLESAREQIRQLLGEINCGASPSRP